MSNAEIEVGITGTRVDFTMQVGKRKMRSDMSVVDTVLVAEQMLRAAYEADEQRVLKPGAVRPPMWSWAEFICEVIAKNGESGQAVIAAALPGIPRAT